MIQTRIIANTLVDLHNDKLTLEALESMVEQINAAYVPLNVEHDPRIPPVGRVLSAWVKELPNNEYALMAEVEMFEETLPEFDPDKRVVRPGWDSSKSVLVYDRSFRSEDDKQSIEALSELIGANLELRVKKSQEPLTILELAVNAGSAIGAGFLAQFGADIYEAAKKELGKLFSNRKANGESLFVFRRHLLIRGEPLIADIHINRPSEQDFDDLHYLDYFLVDAYLERLRTRYPFLDSVVMELQAGRLEARYGIRTDGVPMFLDDVVI